MKTYVTTIVLTLLTCGCLGNILSEKESKILFEDTQLKERIPSPKFYGGYEADWSEYPYVVAITNGTAFRGGGTIIAENFILTHFSSVSSDDVSEIKIVHKDVEKQAAEIINYPYDLQSGTIALIRLEDKFDFNEPNISSISLRSNLIPNGTNCTVVGASGSFSQRPDGSLRYVALPIVDIEECNVYWNRSFPEGHLCTGVYGSKRPTILCGPQAGDPLVCDGLLTGVTSILRSCMFVGENSVFGDVAYYKDWIEEQMKESTTTTTTTTTAAPDSAAVNCLDVWVAIVAVLSIFKIIFNFQ